MQTIYSAEFMQDNCACYSEEKVKLEKYLKDRKEITYLDILNSDISLKDKYWFFCKKIFTKEQNKQISVIIAEIILPIYEEKYPNNKTLREAIEAAKLYAKKEITLEKLMVKRRDVDAVDYAADAEYAHHTAHHTAAASYYATSFAAASFTAAFDDYAGAADYAHHTAHHTAADDSYTQKLEKVLTNFIESN